MGNDLDCRASVRLAAVVQRPGLIRGELRPLLTGTTVMFVLAPVVALAQSSSASFAISRQSIDAGAGRAQGSAYTITASIGQPEAGASKASPSYMVRGGFHHAHQTILPDAVFGDGFEGP